MKKPHVGTSCSVEPNKSTLPASSRDWDCSKGSARVATAFCRSRKCVATMLRTQLGTRLKSSKQPHAPTCETPLRMSASVSWSIWSEQLKGKHGKLA
eukprot:scaffold902_cov242-Pinguiococcus_pyrenoidosus.AAC.4